MASLQRGVPVVLTAFLLACGGGPDGAQEGGASESGGPPAGAAGAAGSFAVGGENYSFGVVRCDLSGSAEDGMLLRGSGTTQDGRRVTLEVERLSNGTVWERASVYLGGIAEGDRWQARMGQRPDGRWFADEAGTTPASGPLIEVSGNELLVESEFTRSGGGEPQAGVLRVSCPG